MHKALYVVLSVLFVFSHSFAADKKGSVKDTHDGKIYKTVTIGTLEWFAENLNYKTDNSWCYEERESNCSKYGRLYSFEAALVACPADWRLPFDADFKNLFDIIGGTNNAGIMLKSKNGWDSNSMKGKDVYGFSALPGGYRNYNDYYDEVRASAYFWSSKTKGENAYYWVFKYDAENADKDSAVKEFAASVRCVKDAL